MVTAYNAWQQNYNEYRALPEEQDAFKVGDNIEAQYKKP
jgi:hypothetical protein